MSAEPEDVAKIEMGCLTCGIKFSVEEKDEVDWTCLVCALRSLVREMELGIREEWVTILAIKQHLNESGDDNYAVNLGISWGRIAEILNRPDVKVIMEGKMIGQKITFKPNPEP